MDLDHEAPKGAVGPGLSHYPETEMMFSLRDKTRARIAAGPIAAVPCRVVRSLEISSGRPPCRVAEFIRSC